MLENTLLHLDTVTFGIRLRVLLHQKNRLSNKSVKNDCATTIMLLLHRNALKRRCFLQSNKVNAYYTYKKWAYYYLGHKQKAQSNAAISVYYGRSGQVFFFYLEPLEHSKNLCVYYVPTICKRTLFKSELPTLFSTEKSYPKPPK